MSLSDARIRNLKPSAKPFKVSDSHGLYLLVKPGGSRLWDLKYRINGKRPVLRWVPGLPSPFLTPASSVKVSVKCWR